jgi:hypothetical protein
LQGREGRWACDSRIHGPEWNDQRYGEGDQVRALAGRLGRRPTDYGFAAAEPTYVRPFAQQRSVRTSGARRWRRRWPMASRRTWTSNVSSTWPECREGRASSGRLGLANTKSPGARYLILGQMMRQVLRGTADRSHLRSAATRVERLVLVTTRAHFARVPWQQGEVAVIEVVRSQWLAYVATKSSGSLKAGIVSVRHGPTRSLRLVLRLRRRNGR